MSDDQRIKTGDERSVYAAGVTTNGTVQQMTGTSPGEVQSPIAQIGL